MAHSLEKNLKKLMAKAVINESALARETEIAQPVINRILQGATTNPNVNTLRPLAKFFKVSLGQLIGDEPLHITSDNTEKEHVLNKDWRDIPITNWEMANQLTPTLRKNLIDENHFICLRGKISEEAFALKIEDIAMEPIFLKGTIVIVEPTQQPTDEDYVITQFKGKKKAVLRQILFNGDEIFFKALNKDFAGLQAAKEFKLLGVVTQTHLCFKECF